MSKLKIGALRLVAIFLVVYPVSAFSTPLSEGQQILHQRLALYQQAFPDIRFIHAGGGANWQEEYARIASLLGNQPDALDYEHPVESSNDLRIVTMGRLAMMLKHNAISETLFRADTNSQLKGSLACVITIDPDDVISNPLAPTAYMLGLPDSTLAKIHHDRRLDPHNFLLFAVDHEIYHCLESALISGAPMTSKTYGGEYNAYRRELSADAFALAMHRRLPERSTTFAHNVMLVRSLWFLDGGPSHRTYPSLSAIQSIPLDELKRKSIKDLVELADKVRNETSEGYEEFLDHQVVALQAAEQLGFAPEEFGPAWTDLAQRKADPRQVTDAARHYLEMYERLFDDAAIDFLPVRRHTERLN